ncbi:TPA: hypothetical protein HA274_07145 [Candidatus Bathyarchaeota archaeon]|nr:hypothetical protein [Candidatus Bathyarchaeota archaeon]
MDNKEKTAEIAAINLQLSTLEQQIKAANGEAKKLTEKRDRLNDDFRKLRQETQNLREKRDSLNEKVQTLKMLRDETHSRIPVITEELRKIAEKINELKKKTPKRKQRDLQQEIDEIEWKIQTTSLDLEEEKQLIASVKQLGIQLDAYKRIENQKKKAIELREHIDTLASQANNFHQEMNVAVQESKEIHARMLSKITESKKVKIDADKLHSAYIEEKEKIKPVNDEYQMLLERRRQLLALVKIEEENERKGREHEMRKHIISEARNKLQKGKELSWDEFQLLNDENSEPQN